MEVWSNLSRVLHNEEALIDREGCQALAQITKKCWKIDGHLVSMVLKQVCLEPGGWMTCSHKEKTLHFSSDNYQGFSSLKNT